MNERNEWSAEWFPIDDAVYFDIAAHAVMPRVAAAAAESSIQANKFPHHVDDANFFDVPNALRSSIATLIGGSAHEVALTTGASTGLQAIAHHIDWRRGDGIVIGGGDFPLHHAVWHPMEERAGAQLTVVAPRDGVIAAEDVIGAITTRTRVVSLSHARFDTGALLDAPRIAAACRASGAWFVLDASQSCGAVPIDVRELGADVLVSAGYKWLLGPYGTGFLWVKDARLDELLPGPFYWTAQDISDFRSLRFDGPKPTRDARRWDAAESAMQLNLNLAAFRASVDLVVRIGPEKVLRHGLDLIDTLFSELPPHCAPASPLGRDRRARSVRSLPIRPMPPRRSTAGCARRISSPACGRERFALRRTCSIRADRDARRRGSPERRMMASIDERLSAMNIVLPDVPPAIVAGYTPVFAPYVRTGNLVSISGRLAKKDGEVWRGKLGSDLTVLEGRAAAGGVAIELLATLRAAAGDLSRVKQIVRLLVLVNGTADFEEPHVVANGASEVFVQLFGERGMHARTAMCAAQLPFGACVEIEMLAEIEAASDGENRS